MFLLLSSTSSPQIRGGKKLMWLLIVMGLGLFITVLNTTWHVSTARWLPYRNVYFFTFLALTTAYRLGNAPVPSMNDPQRSSLVWPRFTGHWVSERLVIPTVWDHLL